MRIYYEVAGQGDLPTGDVKWSSIPLGLSYFPKELAVMPKLCVSSGLHCYSKLIRVVDEHCA